MGAAGNLYLVGGTTDGTEVTGVVESGFVNASGTIAWNTEANGLGTPRRDHALVLHDMRILAIGGIDQDELDELTEINRPDEHGRARR